MAWAMRWLRQGVQLRASSVWAAVSAAVVLVSMGGCKDVDRGASVSAVILAENKFPGKRILLDSCFASSRHGIAIYDCDMPKERVSVELSVGARRSENGKFLIESGYRQWPPGSKVVIKVKISGVFIDRHESGKGMILFVESIEAVEVVDNAVIPD